MAVRSGGSVAAVCACEENKNGAFGPVFSAMNSTVISGHRRLSHNFS